MAEVGASSRLAYFYSSKTTRRAPGKLLLGERHLADLGSSLLGRRLAAEGPTSHHGRGRVRCGDPRSGLPRPWAWV